MSVPILPFGKHKGTPVSDVPTDYLQWLVKQENLRDATRQMLTNELSRRRQAPASPSSPPSSPPSRPSSSPSSPPDPAPPQPDDLALDGEALPEPLRGAENSCIPCYCPHCGRHLLVNITIEAR